MTSGARLGIWIVAGLFITAPAAAQTVRDDFSGPGFSAENWFPCERDENALSIVLVPEQGFNAAKLLVNPRAALALVALGPGHSGCRHAGAVDYSSGAGDERAELWEADHRRLKFGTDVWYRFAMYIDPALPADRSNRLVIGQWKAEGAHSPFIAQRIVNGQFIITLEQDNDDPTSHRDDDECRIVLAFAKGFQSSLRGEFGNSMFQALPDRGPIARDNVRAGSIAHDQHDAIKGMWARVDPCALDLDVVRTAHLPDAVGHWTTMLYHLRATAAGDGLIEVWANGNPVASARGRFGFRDGRSGLQYFKFGPYRDHAAYSTYALLARFARGATREAVE